MEEVLVSGALHILLSSIPTSGLESRGPRRFRCMRGKFSKFGY